MTWYYEAAVECDKCGDYENGVEFTELADLDTCLGLSHENLPEGWEEVEGEHLCPDCLEGKEDE